MSLLYKTNMTKTALTSLLKQLTAKKMSIYGPNGITAGRLGSPLLMTKVVSSQTRYSVLDIPVFDVAANFITHVPADSGATTPPSNLYTLKLDIQLFINKGVTDTAGVDLAGFAVKGIDAGTAITTLGSSIPDLSNYPIDYLDTSLPLSNYFNEYDYTLYYIPSGIADSSEVNVVPFVDYSTNNGSTWYHNYMPYIAPEGDGYGLFGVNGSTPSSTTLPTGGNQPNVKIKCRNSVIYTTSDAAQVVCTNTIAYNDELGEAYKFITASDAEIELASLEARVTALEEAIPIISSTGNYIAL